MSAETLIISCTGRDCGQKLRVPADRGRLFVTCPKCQTSWEWTAEASSVMPQTSEAAPTRRQRNFSRTSVAMGVLGGLVVIAGLWTHAWLPIGLFLLACLIRWICRRELSQSDSKTLWQRGAGVLYETTAGVCSAIAIGLALVIALVTFLNLYPNINATNFPAWLMRFENLLIKISAWTQTSDNKLKITVVYISVIVCCFLLTLVARRYKKEWRPVRSVTRFKQTANKILLAIQVIALFTFFSHAPINEHVDKLALEQAWRYGVAKRAEEQFEAKRLIAEELAKAAKDQKNVEQDEKDDFLQSISELRSKLPSLQVVAQPISSNNTSPDPPRSGPGGWKPPNWPRPPDSVSTKIKTGTPLEARDYEPAPSFAQRPKSPNTPTPPSEVSRITEAKKVVANQIESVIPSQSSSYSAPIPFDSQVAKIFPPKTSDQWQAANALVAEQELKANLAERRYGEAVQVLLEGISEYLSMQVPADPVLGTWIDLALSDLSDRVYDHLFSKDSGRFAKVTEQLRNLFTPRETKAAKLKERIDNHLIAGDYDAAEPLIAELAKYPKTKAGKSSASLAEDVSFRRVVRAVTPDNEPDRIIEKASNYLSHHGRSKRAPKVREWLASANAKKALIEIEAAKPKMHVYLREGCAMSQHYLADTAQDPNVIAERGRFQYQELNVDVTPPPVSFGTEEVSLPIVVFQNANGQVVETLTGRSALMPTTLTMHMRAVAAARAARVPVVRDPIRELRAPRAPAIRDPIQEWLNRRGTNSAPRSRSGCRF